ncbi:hypothetical protein I3843_05G100400 [Carya illinoinensis]|nr:hypothetical protein I3843_05G100400 [Carya illinoinensis]
MRRMIKIINPLFKKSSTSRAFARKKGRNNVTVDDLVQVVTPKGRAPVPDSVKAELLQRIRTFLTSASI